MAFQDKMLTCKDCGKEFTWTAGEQEFYASKGFDNPPSRCIEDRKKYKAQKRGFNGGDRKMYPITCSRCGKADEVPFEPRSDREVLCKQCFAETRNESQRS